MMENWCVRYFRYVLVGYVTFLTCNGIEISWASFDETLVELVECWFNVKSSDRDILRFRVFLMICWYDSNTCSVCSGLDLEVSDLPQTLPTRPWGYDEDGVSLGKQIRSSLVVLSCVMCSYHSCRNASKCWSQHYIWVTGSWASSEQNGWNGRPFSDRMTQPYLQQNGLCITYNIFWLIYG